MADDLRCFLEDRPIRARRVGPVERLGRWCRRNKSLASLTGTTLFLLVLVAVVASVGYVRTRTPCTEKRWSAPRPKPTPASPSKPSTGCSNGFPRRACGFCRNSPWTGTGGETIELPSSPILSKEAAALLEEMLPFYDRLAQQTGNDDKLRARTAEANRRVGAIRQRLGQFEEAAKAYRRAIALYEELRARSPANPTLKLEVAQIENELGRIFTSRRQVAEAREAHLAALALLQDDGALPSAPAALRFELARTCYFLGTQERPLPAADPRQGDRPGSDSRRATRQSGQGRRLAQSIAGLASGQPGIPASARTVLPGRSGGRGGSRPGSQRRRRTRHRDSRRVWSKPSRAFPITPMT